MKNLFCKNFKITKNKSFQAESYLHRPKFLYCIFDLTSRLFTDEYYFINHLNIFGDLFWINFSFDKKQDHAGIELGFGICGLNFGAGVTDNRHWNYDEDRWYEPNEDLSINNSPNGSYLYC